MPEFTCYVDPEHLQEFVDICALRGAAVDPGPTISGRVYCTVYPAPLNGSYDFRYVQEQTAFEIGYLLCKMQEKIICKFIESEQ